MRPIVLKVGQLAKRTGISIRTLHYYDEIGLLSPSHRSDAGYRLYAASDIARLQQIRSLQQLGLSLTEIRDCLDRPSCSLQCVIDLHMSRLKEQITLQQRLYERLEAITTGLRSTTEISVEAFMQTLEVMTRMEKYYTPEQLEYLKQRRQTVGEERIREVEAEWPRLIEEVRVEMESGTDPASERVQQLARRWMALVQEFTGGDPGIQQSLSTMYRQEQPQDVHPSLDPRMREYMAYINKALGS
ncbi:MAG TPA: MerR family transcriptional regulator [Chloroflexota bacterium]|nr:MerR family transcriptional regulator [Chloroflexota bacterium]